jgi:uncharacterized damage-inducible protein DinB
MELIPMLLKEMEQEAQTTRKMLERVPDDKFSWQPHPKSMTFQRLASHLAELPDWVTMAVTKEGLDFGTGEFEPRLAKNHKELMETFEKSLVDGKAHLEKANEALLNEGWTLRAGEQVLYQASKADVIRMSFCQTVHHRAQLGVFLRLNDIPIPASYGPSADEH